MPPAMFTSVTGTTGLAALAWVLLVTAPMAQAQKKITLNDTGQTLCSISGVFSTDCKGSGQDADYGRDVTDNPAPNDRGVAGFAFEKVCNSGEREFTGQCLPSAKLGSGPNDWGCTRDKVTKLIWEVKTTDGGLRDMNMVYSNWRDNTKGSVGAFVNAVNAQGLCGAKNWRLPTAVELESLLNFGVAYPGPMIDTKWFPNTVTMSLISYWVAETGKGGGAGGWSISFASGQIYNTSFYPVLPTVRLVRNEN